VTAGERLAVGAAIGLAVGLASELLVRWLPGRIPEAVPQPAWTGRIRRPPMLEVLGVGLGLALASQLDGTRLALSLALLAVLVPVTVIDLEHRVIPDQLVVAGAVAGFAIVAFYATDALASHAVAAGVAAVVLLVPALVSPEGMGMGDVKLAFALGALLGGRVAIALVLAVVVAGAFAGGVLVARGRAARGVGIPLGPFLAAGAIMAAGIPDLSETSYLWWG